MIKGLALVTGASSGIGAATARALAADGWRAHVTARRAGKLTALADEIGATPHAIDATDHAAMTALVEAHPFDLIVANAGRGGGLTGLADTDPADIDAVIGINVTALLHLARAAIRTMGARGRGHFISLGSVGGLYPTPQALYGASKHAARAVIRNLRMECHGKGLRFTDIQPGRVVTEFYDVAIADEALRDKVKDTGIVDLEAADIAEAIRWAAAQPPHVNISALEIMPTGQTMGGVRYGHG